MTVNQQLKLAAVLALSEGIQISVTIGGYHIYGKTPTKKGKFSDCQYDFSFEEIDNDPELLPLAVKNVAVEIARLT